MTLCEEQSKPLKMLTLVYYYATEKDQILKARNKKASLKAVSYCSRPVYSRLGDLGTSDVPFK